MASVAEEGRYDAGVFDRLFVETGCSTSDSHVMRRLHVRSGAIAGGCPDRAKAFIGNGD
jgi:hypothetical protein